MSCAKKHSVMNLRKANSTISFSFLLFATFFVACSTSTISSDDSDEGDDLSFAVEQKEEMFNPDIDYGSMTDSRNGQVYRTVEIGEQVWMAENLNYAVAIGSYCYGNYAANCAKYGRLYTWAAAIDSVKIYDGGNGEECGNGKTCTLPKKVQGVCPDGWHLPSKTEWATLFSNVGERDNAGKVLRSQTGWIDRNHNVGNGTDDFGFTGLSAGRMISEGDFRYEGIATGFWSSDEIDSENAYDIYLFSGYDHVGLRNDGIPKYEGFYVRCLKN